MSLNTLSPEFRDSLLKSFDGLGKKAQIGPPIDAGSVGQPAGADEVAKLIQTFNDSFVREWLQSLSPADLSEVKRVFEELSNLSPDEMKQLSGGASPFELVGSMFKSDCGCDDSAGAMVVEVEPEAGHPEMSPASPLEGEGVTPLGA
jgi:hypothetical protein